MKNSAKGFGQIPKKKFQKISLNQTPDTKISLLFPEIKEKGTLLLNSGLSTLKESELPKEVIKSTIIFQSKIILEKLKELENFEKFLYRQRIEDLRHIRECIDVSYVLISNGLALCDDSMLLPPEGVKNQMIRLDDFTTILESNFLVKLGEISNKIEKNCNYDIDILDTLDEITLNHFKLLLFKFLSVFIVATNLKNQEIEKEAYKKIKTIGQKLYKKYGIQGMHSKEIWNYLPQSFYNALDKIFDGIGEWQA